MAIMSGALAAEAIIKAPTGRYDRESLSLYAKLLDETVLRELKAYRGADVALSNPRIYKDYVRLLNNLLKDYLTVDGEPRRIYLTLPRALRRGDITLWTS